MARLIGMFLIITSVIVLASAFIHLKSSDNLNTAVTGNIVYNIIEQPDIELSFSDYLDGVLLSYSIISMTVGIILLSRFKKPI